MPKWAVLTVLQIYPDFSGDIPLDGEWEELPAWAVGYTCWTGSSAPKL